jgi:predicted hydrocarbon binding protein
MAAPAVPIEVDDETGVWTTDSLPMLYVPRHFFINNHKAIEEALGTEAYAKQLYDAGYKSAWHWCEKEAAAHGLRGEAVFHHYMKRLSQRGWGLFRVEQLDMEQGTARVRLDNSAFVYEYGPHAERRVCYMFAGWFPGSLEWVAQDLGRPLKLKAEEVQCASEAGQDHCIFEVTPA